ncbi:3-oxoacyl-ACP reductase FabG [Nocardiopsis sp. CT-R113]|uniref:3-oxoacyl-ACP reductase FabG n=1 Tax=Nocardiopsis codii TaxID=3065942 RepID=A0ABU7KBQ7_9ACTN|nr:3-oxoacyl-ACP reductase FabG [Nocardiopsis sp. CT-R113]MEE2039670.1 3-oxoacyl-ACP reductase FabG [Nocardiopsis sp. CT-R113]
MGRTVLVTGGTRGIGLGIAKGFAEAGDRVVIVGRDEARTREAARGVPGAQWVVGDVAKAADCAHVVEQVVRLTGGLDVLCANAGIFPSSPLVSMGEDELDRVLDTNIKGTVLMVQAAVEALTASGRGRVVITSSITGPLTGYAGWSHYGATKAAQLGFMRSAALELAPRGITVNAVLPGNVRTEGLDELGADYLERMRAAIPVGRVGEVEDIAAACVFLASAGASFITGQSLVVDGGQVLPEDGQAFG